VSLQQEFEDAYAAEDTDDLGDRIGETVRAFESRLGRPLSQSEYDQIEFAEAQKTITAEQANARVMEGLGADMNEQWPRLEAKLGRKLLTHEMAGILDQSEYAAMRGAESMDAEAAYERYWTHRTARTGDEPPDMSRVDQADRHMAQRMRELNAQSDAAAAGQAEADSDEWKVEFNDSGTMNAEHENAKRMQARLLELNGQPIPTWLEGFANPEYVTAQHEQATDQAA
jgi:hypothetical protein